MDLSYYAELILQWSLQAVPTDLTRVLSQGGDSFVLPPKEVTIENGDVKLFCRISGNGAPILLIHGAACDCDYFAETAKHLSALYTVIAYDRRGHSRSSKPVNGDHSVDIQAEDAACIIRYIGSPCFVIGHSAGTIFAMRLAEKYPELIRGMLLHEPPLLDCLPPDCIDRRDFTEVSRLIHMNKHSAATAQFLTNLGPPEPRLLELDEETMQRNLDNLDLFLEKEYDEVIFWKPDYEKLKSIPVTIGLGSLSAGTSFEIVEEELSRRIGSNVAFFPGRHNGALDLPSDFAAVVAGVFLQQK